MRHYDSIKRVLVTGGAGFLGVITSYSIHYTKLYDVAGAQAYWIDVSPVFLRLWMHLRVAVDFAGRGLQDPGFDALGQTEHVDRAMHADLGSRHRVKLRNNFV